MRLLEHSNSMHKYKKRKLFSKYNIVKSLVVFLISLLIIGYFYESGEARKYVEADPGKTITVNQVQYSYEVTKGKTYTVIVDGAAGESLLTRKALIEGLGEDYRLFFYERPGYGRTDGEQKTPGELAEDLHFMFRKFGWSMNFILIGEEFGSVVMQEFINRYPEEVLGAIFINPTGQMMGSEKGASYAQETKERKNPLNVFATFGIPRLLHHTGIVSYDRNIQFNSIADQDYYSNLWLSKDHVKAAESELDMMAAMEPVEIRQGTLTNRPVYLMTTNRNLQEMEQSRYLSYSSNTETVIVSDSIGEILLERPQDVVSTFHALIKKMDRLK
ncbi:MAG TPA: alpha/beta hydrolase [Clostridiaceae bacterium]|nr:alpha/beta hydrolase [Clostridiaceae bacterium]